MRHAQLILSFRHLAPRIDQGDSAGEFNIWGHSQQRCLSTQSGGRHLITVMLMDYGRHGKTTFSHVANSVNVAATA